MGSTRMDLESRVTFMKKKLTGVDSIKEFDRQVRYKEENRFRQARNKNMPE
jgi:hypothetical protein